MAQILCFDTSTKMCSVGLASDGRSLSLTERAEDSFIHSEQLNLFIKEVLDKADVAMSELDAVAVGRGPGSYTGLRIGVSSAKGLCYALGIPLIAIDTLHALITQVAPMIGETELLCPMLDARRMEVFTALYTKSGHLQEEISARIIDELSYSDLLEENVVHFLGDGMDKCREILSRYENARFHEDIQPSAQSMMALAEAKFKSEDFEDVAYFEPFYLKEFMATTPKKLL